ncbi:hypothetical protein K493DRAFT_333086 [Basidiobolus meristosporus CBS 931.73]|uniref:Rhodanese domain-containing protein n=1 Tax=Basidiobolus meristosporus CBS 931.73 TaxID=1314790 RepID=A0A1Y1Z8J7_9FUNG|nr:hypothetical protein K493DRAFT_333086 [Basidiobolus meristosporus CBS 931.73]|eukprot:ORY06588.1 hypothetical protein K493DRAFT_333086 [Basidiobolus meristosporus CBS 931.73]
MSSNINTSDQRGTAIHSIEELERNAAVIQGLKLPAKIWCTQANRLYEQANVSREKGDLVNAYIQYYKFNNIVTSVIPQNSNEFREKTHQADIILNQLRGELVSRFGFQTSRNLYSTPQLSHERAPSANSSTSNLSQSSSSSYATVSRTSNIPQTPVYQEQYTVQRPPEYQPVPAQESVRENNRPSIRKSDSEYSLNTTAVHEFDANGPDIRDSMLRFPQVEDIHDASFSGATLSSDLDIERVSQRYPSLDHVNSINTSLNGASHHGNLGYVYGASPAQDPTFPQDSHGISPNAQSMPSNTGPTEPNPQSAQSNLKQNSDGPQSSTKLKSPTRTPSRRWFSSNAISKTSFAFPHATVISTSALHQYLCQTSNPPSILLMDIRPREEFDRGHIEAKHIINIDPMILKNETTSSKIEAALQLCSAKERSLFNERHKVDLVVFYDQSSTSLTQRPIELGGDLTANPLQHLVSAIYELEFEKVLIRMPVLLSGGYQAWKNQYGGGKIPSSKVMGPRHNQHQLPRTITKLTIHHSFHSQVPRLPDNTSSEQIDMLVNKLNQSTITSSNVGQPAPLEVYDYFQQNATAANQPPYPDYPSKKDDVSPHSGMPQQSYPLQYDPHNQQHIHGSNWSALSQQTQNADRP